MIDENTLLNEVFDKLNKMSREELIETLRKAGLPIPEEEEEDNAPNS